MITLDLPPQIQETVVATANAQGVSVNDYILNAITTSLENDTVKSIDDVMVFDMEVMQERLKGFESKEEALKNSTPIPKWALQNLESFQQWLREGKAKRAVV